MFGIDVGLGVLRFGFEYALGLTGVGFLEVCCFSMKFPWLGWFCV